MTDHGIEVVWRAGFESRQELRSNRLGAEFCDIVEQCFSSLFVFMKHKVHPSPGFRVVSLGHLSKVGQVFQVVE